MFVDLLPAFADELVKLAKSATEKVDEHHAASSKDWRLFERRLKGKKFREAVLRHPDSDEKLQRYTQTYGEYLVSKKPVGIAKSESSKRRYVIKKLPSGRLGCGCKSWQFFHSHRGSDCKHIQEHERLKMKQ